MKRAIIFSAAVILIVLIGLVAVINYASLSKSKPFYVGVTFGGNTATEAKQLIDRVKNYTNLLVVQSDQLQYNISEMEDACDYAVKSGLDIIVYFGYDTPKPTPTANEFINTAPERYEFICCGVWFRAVEAKVDDYV